MMPPYVWTRSRGRVKKARSSVRAKLSRSAQARQASTSAAQPHSCVMDPPNAWKPNYLCDIGFLQISRQMSLPAGRVQLRCLLFWFSKDHRSMATIAPPAAAETPPRRGGSRIVAACVTRVMRRRAPTISAATRRRLRPHAVRRPQLQPVHPVAPRPPVAPRQGHSGGNSCIAIRRSMPRRCIYSRDVRYIARPSVATMANVITEPVLYPPL